ncbi:DUF4381 domain-containing protein [Pseudidiomarina sp. E22-M8]|uniref:DUF4381 domain-containing protein n=1 Tax=Pseudidiomarina sp. E22-M8 TaxID=3424768 RepID=UPI00403D09D2
MIDATPASAQMHDILLPPAAGWWPLAPGWYVLAALVLTSVSLLIWLLVHSYRRRRVRRAAVAELHPQLPLNTTTLVLKRACYGYFPHQEVASLTGSAWRDFLLEQLRSTQAARFVDLLVEVEHAAYQQTTNEPEQLRQRYHDFAKFWLRHALPRRSND